MIRIYNLTWRNFFFRVEIPVHPLCGWTTQKNDHFKRLLIDVKLKDGFLQPNLLKHEIPKIITKIQTATGIIMRKNKESEEEGHKHSVSLSSPLLGENQHLAGDAKPSEKWPSGLIWLQFPLVIRAPPHPQLLFLHLFLVEWRGQAKGRNGKRIAVVCGYSGHGGER